MSRFIGIAMLCLLPTALANLAVRANAQDRSATKPSNQNEAADPQFTATGLTGEVLVIESKDGTSVVVEQPKIRWIAGAPYLGGKVLPKNANATAAAGNRVWIIASDIKRIVEFDTKDQLTARTPAAEPTDAVAKIEALGGQVQRDASQPGNPVIAVSLAQNEKLTDDDLQVLSSFPGLQSLQLSATDISDAGLKHVAGLTNLTYLGLIGTKVSDAGMKDLVGLQNLQELRVGNTALTDAGLNDLAKLKNLKMVGLIGTQVTDAGLKEFSAALPNMRHNRGPEGQNAAGGQGGGQRSDPNFTATVDKPAYPSEHPLVLFDEAHQNFHTAGGRYKPFADLITSDGCQITPNSHALTAARLSPYQLLVISNAMGPISDDEVQAIHDWVDGGGALLLIVDHPPFGEVSRALAKSVGVEMGQGFTADPANQTDTGLLFDEAKGRLSDHPIIRGRNESEHVHKVLTFSGRSLKGPPDSVPLLKFAETAVDRGNGSAVSAADRSQGLALKLGKGRVVVLGEAGQLSAQVVGNPPSPFGMNVPGCDNRQLALNIVHWLTGLTD